MKVIIFMDLPKFINLTLFLKQYQNRIQNTSCPLNHKIWGHNYPTKHLNSFVDVLLKPFLLKITGYVRDNFWFSKEMYAKVNISYANVTSNASVCKC